MINLIASNTPVTVGAGKAVPFSATPVRSRRADKECNCQCGWFTYELGSSLIGIANNTDHQIVLELSYNANITSPATTDASETVSETTKAGTGHATATATALELAINVDGETLEGTEALFTPSSAGTYGNVSASRLIKIPCHVDVTVTLNNIGSAPLQAKNVSLTIKKLA